MHHGTWTQLLQQITKLNGVKLHKTKPIITDFGVYAKVCFYL